jgi:AcrR family transcriptional regulator
MLEKGIRGASLRDICKAAGVSIGALYVHFATTDDVIMAACMIGWDTPDAGEWQKLSKIRTWDDYVQYMHADVMRLEDPVHLAHFRLVLEFIAELTKRQTHLEAMASFTRHFRQVSLEKLSEIAETGEISLPLGLGATCDIHQQLLHGAYYTFVVEVAVPLRQIADTMVLAMAATAGVRAPTNSETKKKSATKRLKTTNIRGD